jgi:hypothetical protein
MQSKLNGVVGQEITFDFQGEDKQGVIKEITDAGDYIVSTNDGRTVLAEEQDVIELGEMQKITPEAPRKKRFGLFESGGDLGGEPKEVKGYRVRIFSSDIKANSNLLDGKNSAVLVTDGKTGDSSTVMSNEPHLRLITREIFGKKVLHAEPVNYGNEGKHKMFGGTFLWSSDSRFRNDVSEQPIALHDRVEFAEGGTTSTKYKIFEGYDHFNNKPLYKVTDNEDYEGEWHTNKSDAQQELDELNNSFAEGGNIEQENNQMLHSQAVEAKHHIEELDRILNSSTKVEPWVLSKMTRAKTDLSDITHYLEGENKASMRKPIYAKGGGVGKKALYQTNQNEKLTKQIIDTSFEFFKSNGVNYGQVADLGTEITIEPSTVIPDGSTLKKGSLDGMQIIYDVKSKVYEVSEYMAGPNEDELFIYGEYKSLIPALKSLIKGNSSTGRKPIKKYEKGGKMSKGGSVSDYTNQSDLKSSLLNDSAFTNLFLPGEQSFIAKSETKIFKKRGILYFTDGKREVVFSADKPFSKYKKLGNASAILKQVYSENKMSHGGGVNKNVESNIITEEENARLKQFIKHPIFKNYKEIDTFSSGGGYNHTMILLANNHVVTINWESGDVQYSYYTYKSVEEYAGEPEDDEKGWDNEFNAPELIDGFPNYSDLDDKTFLDRMMAIKKAAGGKMTGWKHKK